MTETRNRYRLRFAKLSEVLPRSERSLASVRMTDWVSFAPFGQDDKAGDLEPVPASLRELQELRCDFFEFGGRGRVDFDRMHIDAGFVLLVQAFKSAFDSADVTEFAQELL